MVDEEVGATYRKLWESSNGESHGCFFLSFTLLPTLSLWLGIPKHLDEKETKKKNENRPHGLLSGGADKSKTLFSLVSVKVGK